MEAIIVCSVFSLFAIGVYIFSITPFGKHIMGDGTKSE
jgi:hypothetical protein